MNSMNIFVVLSLVITASLFVGTMAASVLAVSHDNMTMNMDDNMSSMGNVTGDGNSTLMTETERLPTANQTGRV